MSAAPLEKGVGALAARRGAAADRPALKSNLVARRVVQMGEAQWVVKNVDATKYYSFDEGTWGLIQLFDGTRTLAEIHETYQAMIPGEVIEPTLVPGTRKCCARWNCSTVTGATCGAVPDEGRSAPHGRAEGGRVRHFLIPSTS
jgi:hypothetical protein